MKTPFSSEEFLMVFKNYNVSVFPAQLVILLAGFFLIFMILRKRRSNRIYVSIYLGLLWIWAGAVYHIAFFRELNKPALIFGVVFIIQGLSILLEGFRSKKINFLFTKNAITQIGMFFIIFGLLIYPMISWIADKSVVHIISAGLPCPTVIVTFGFFMQSISKIRWYLLIIPVLWSIIGISAALNFGIYQDFMMIIAAMAVIFINRKQQVSSSSVPV